MKERDMMYGGYYQGIPGYNTFGNYGYQGPPGSLMQMSNPYMNGNNYLDNNPLNDINNRLNELEIKVNNIEKRLGKNNIKDDDDSIYML